MYFTVQDSLQDCVWVQDCAQGREVNREEGRMMLNFNFKELMLDCSDSLEEGVTLELNKLDIMQFSQN